MKKTLKFESMSILEILIAIFTVAGFPKLIQPDKVVGKKTGLIVRSPVAKRLFTVVKILNGERVRLAQEHEVLHKAEHATPVDCAAFRKSLRAIEQKMDVITSLLFQAILEEHPYLVFHDFGYTSDWSLVITGENKKLDKKPQFTKAHPARNIIRSIKNVLAGAAVELQKDFPTQESGDSVVGVVKDYRAKAIYSLSYNLAVTGRNMFPELKTATGHDDIVAWLLTQKRDNIKLGASQLKHIRLGINCLDMVFGAILQDSHPTLDGADFHIRKGWKICKEPANPLLSGGILVVPGMGSFQVPPGVHVMAAVNALMRRN